MLVSLYTSDNCIISLSQTCAMLICLLTPLKYPVLKKFIVLCSIQDFLNVFHHKFFSVCGFSNYS